MGLLRNRMTANPHSSFFLGKSQRFSWSFIGIVVTTTAIVAGFVTRDVKQGLGYCLVPLPGLLLAERWRITRLQQQQTQWHSSLQETINRQEVRLLELEQYENQLNQAIAVTQQVNQDLQADNQSLKSERFLLGQQLAGLKHRWDKLSLQFASLKPQKHQLEQELATLTAVVKRADHHKQTIEQNLRDSSQQLQQIEHSCHAIQGELSHLSEAILEKQHQHQHLSHAIADLERDYQTQQERQARLASQESQLVSHIHHLETHQASLTQTHDNLLAEIQGLETQKQTLTQAIADQAEQKADIEACVAYLHQEYDHLQREIAEINHQVLSLDEELTPSGLS